MLKLALLEYKKKQRLLLLLDEPTAGLDPEERIMFRRLICGFSENKTILLSTHIIDDIEATYEQTAILFDGRIIGAGYIDDMISEMEGKVWQIIVDGKFDDKMIYNRGGILISRVSNKDRDYIRFLSDNCLFDEAVPATPRLEDAYIWKCDKVSKR